MTHLILQTSEQIDDVLACLSSDTDKSKNIWAIRDGESSSGSLKGSDLLPHFMAIRLTLLRPKSRRSTQENEMIDILKYSFRAYSKDNRRSGAELATLLAKDWICLKSSFDGTTKSPTAQEVPSMPQLGGVLPASTSSGDGISCRNQRPLAQSIVSYDHSKKVRSDSTGIEPLLVRSSNADGMGNPNVVSPNLITDIRD